MGLLDQYKKATVDQSSVQPVASVPAPERLVAKYQLPDGTTGELVSSTDTIGRFALPDGAQRDVALATVTPHAPSPVTVDQTTAPVPAVVDSTEAPKKRGRKAKAEEVESAVKEAFDTVKREVLGPEPRAAGVRLYVGCAPVGVQTQTLHAYADEIETSILRMLEETLPDIRLSGNEMLTFGKWKAVLAQSVIKSPPPPGHYVVPGIPGEKTQVVVDALVGVLSKIPGAVVMR